MKCRVLFSGRINIGLPCAGSAHSALSVLLVEMFLSGVYVLFYRGKNSSVLLEVSDSKSRIQLNDIIVILKFTPAPPTYRFIIHNEKSTAYDIETTAYNKNTMGYNYFTTEHWQICEVLLVTLVIYTTFLLYISFPFISRLTTPYNA